MIALKRERKGQPPFWGPSPMKDTHLQQQQQAVHATSHQRNDPHNQHAKTEASSAKVSKSLESLGPPVAPFYRFFFFGEGSPTKIDYRKRSGTLIPTSLREDLNRISGEAQMPWRLQRTHGLPLQRWQCDGVRRLLSHLRLRYGGRGANTNRTALNAWG